MLCYHLVMTPDNLGSTLFFFEWKRKLLLEISPYRNRVQNNTYNFLTPETLSELNAKILTNTFLLFNQNIVLLKYLDNFGLRPNLFLRPYKQIKIKCLLVGPL